MGFVLGELSLNQSLTENRPAGGKSNIQQQLALKHAASGSAWSSRFSLLSFVMQLTHKLVLLNVLGGPLLIPIGLFGISEALLSLVGR